MPQVLAVELFLRSPCRLLYGLIHVEGCLLDITVWNRQALQWLTLLSVRFFHCWFLELWLQFLQVCCIQNEERLVGV